LDVHLKRFDENPKSFALWLTWNGTNPNLKSILVNSHMDVVAVDPERWTYPPFDAHKDENGTIYGRGAQDMKPATVAQLEAVKRLKAQNFRPLRTIHMSILPDEEVGGHLGMQRFINSSEFAALNVGFDIDEASASASDQMVVVHGEKSIWRK
jgi:aminoacylase